LFENVWLTPKRPHACRSAQTGHTKTRSVMVWAMVPLLQVARVLG
jgi:hypothetical protein